MLFSPLEKRNCDLNFANESGFQLIVDEAKGETQIQLIQIMLKLGMSAIYKRRN